MIEKNQQIELNITGFSHEGAGVGKIDGFAVFVDGAVEGEKVKIQITKVKQSYAYSELLEILEPSDDRVVPECRFYGKCGGCGLSHISYVAQLRFKTNQVKDAIKRIGGFSGDVVLDTIAAENPLRYRNKAQFPLRQSGYKPEIGFFKPRSHNLVPLDDCLLTDERHKRLFEILLDFISEFKVSLYDEESHNGLIRHLLTRVSSSGELTVCLVINGDRLENSTVLAERLREISGFAALCLNINKEKTNVILGKKILPVFGEPKWTENINGLDFTVSPLSFFQVNTRQAERLFNLAVDFADPSSNDTVLDAYCGAGTFSLFYASKAKNVIGVEIVPEAVSDAVQNAENNGIANVEFILGKAELEIPRLIGSGVKPAIISLDPPRAGCDAALLHAIVQSKAQKVVYVSCNPQTLARDLRVLHEGGYNLIKVQPVDMFPQTSAIECVALLSL